MVNPKAAVQGPNDTLEIAMKEIKRLELVVRYAGVMLAECEEYKSKGICKHAATNILLGRASEQIKRRRK